MSKNQLNNMILNIKENFNEEEVLQTIQEFFPAFVLVDTYKKTAYNYHLPKGYIYSCSQKAIYYKNKQIKLTKKEILFLELLFKNSSRFVTYREFSNHVWIDSPMTEFSIRSIVKNLRKKLSYNFIENLSGVGYKLLIK